MSKVKKKRTRHLDPLANLPDERPMSCFESGMDLNGVDLGMFTADNVSVADSCSSLKGGTLTGWKVKSQKRTWVKSAVPEE